MSVADCEFMFFEPVSCHLLSPFALSSCFRLRIIGAFTHYLKKYFLIYRFCCKRSATPVLIAFSTFIGYNLGKLYKLWNRTKKAE